jgi:hypothetical protein
MVNNSTARNLVIFGVNTTGTAEIEMHVSTTSGGTYHKTNHSIWPTSGTDFYQEITPCPARFLKFKAKGAHTGLYVNVVGKN